MSTHFWLVTGRTAEQGKELHRSKGSTAYLEATSLAEMNASDMARLNTTAGQTVRLCAGAQEALVTACPGPVPPGVIFLPLGPAANKLASAATEGTGTPLFKGMPVRAEGITDIANRTDAGGKS